MKAKFIPVIATVSAIGVLFTIAFTLKAGDEAKARQECLGSLVRPAMAPEDPGYGEAWIAYSQDVKICVGAP